MHSLFSIPPRNFSARSSHSTTPRSARVALAEAEQVCRFLPQAAEPRDHDKSAFSYRHDWGNVDANANLFLEWESIGPASQVFVSLAEGTVDGSDFGKGFGTTRCSLAEVAQKNGGIGIRVNVEGGRPIRLFANYLVINA